MPAMEKGENNSGRNDTTKEYGQPYKAPADIADCTEQKHSDGHVYNDARRKEANPHYSFTKVLRCTNLIENP